MLRRIPNDETKIKEEAGSSPHLPIPLPRPLWSKMEKNTDKIAIHERGSERSERASERVSGASERANGRASVPVLQSVFLAVFDHSETSKKP